MCPSCAVRTPTGYLCRDCVRQHQKIFDTAVWYDYLFGFAATFILSLIASVITVVVAPFIGFYMIFLAAGLGGGAGVLIANITLRVINKRRSKPLFIACAAGVVSGALAIALGLFFTGSFYALIWLAIYVVVVTPVVYTRIAGIQL
jgi:drug/metabolite transporter (DMT)-like permease